MAMHILQANRKCTHGFMRNVGELWRPVLLMQSELKISKTVLCKECTYVQKDINESDENFDSTQDNEPTLSSSFFMKDL